MAFEVEVSERKDSGPKKKPAPLPSRDRNLYAGIFAGYSKQYEESFPGKPPQKMRTYSFLTTHACALGKYLPLETRVVSKYKAASKWVYSKTAQSGLALIIESLCGEAEAQRIEALPKEQKGAAIADALDNAVGKYCKFSAWANYWEKDGQENYSGNRIDGKSFVEPDDHLRRIEKAVEPKLELSYTTDPDEPRRYLKHPKGAEVEAAAEPRAAVDDDFAGLDESIPF